MKLSKVLLVALSILFIASCSDPGDPDKYDTPRSDPPAKKETVKKQVVLNHDVDVRHTSASEAVAQLREADVSHSEGTIERKWYRPNREQYPNVWQISVDLPVNHSRRLMPDGIHADRPPK